MRLTKNSYLIVAGLIAWFSVLFQIILSLDIMMANGRTFWDALDRVMIFFTNLTNLGLSLYYLAHLFPEKSIYRRFWIRPLIEGCLALYLIVVGVIFALLLQPYIHHQGWTVLADRLLHYVTPGMYLFYWFYFVSKGVLRWENALWWLMAPLLYFVYVLIRGFHSGSYPYPFLNAHRMGYEKVLLNALGFLLFFWLIGVCLVAVDRQWNKDDER